MPDVFVMLRHVSNSAFNEYWIESYRSIRKHYPTTPIKIIDNNSCQEYLTSIELTNCEVIRAEFPQTRLYSPFYECLKFHEYERAIVIHDGILFNEHVDFSTVRHVKFLWHFETHAYDNPILETTMLHTMNKSDELLETYQKDWYGCMGCLTVVNLSFLRQLETTYGFTKLIPFLNNQTDAIAFERVFAVLCYTGYPELREDPSFEGDIQHMVWGYTMEMHKQAQITNKRIVKLFGARK